MGREGGVSGWRGCQHRCTLAHVYVLVKGEGGSYNYVTVRCGCPFRPEDSQHGQSLTLGRDRKRLQGWRRTTNVNHDNDNAQDLRSRLDLDLAINRVRAGILSGCFPNRLDAAIIKHLRSDVKCRVEQLLGDDSMDWANGSARFFDLPKQDGLVRPICYMDVDVAVTYQALVDAASSLIEKHMSPVLQDRVLSHKLTKPSTATMFEPPSQAYRNYIKIQHQMASSGKYSHCLRLDVANYYERIYQHKLRHLLDRYNVPGVIATALGSLLRKLSNGDSHGIPQGHWASDYLGRIYLLYLDEHLLARGTYAVRYVDDYRIFCRSEHEAHLLLKECVGLLRTLGLNVQPNKTSIVTVSSLDPELKPITQRFLNLKENTVLLRPLDNPYVDETDLWEEERAKTPVTVENVRDFENLWTEAIDQEDKRESILKFALSGLTAGESPTAEGFILDNLGDFPNLASAFTKYLISLGFKHDTASKLLDFLESDECIHEWQKMWILEYFRGTKSSIEPYKARLRELLSDSNQHPLVRALIAELIGSRGEEIDAEYVRRLFADETDPRLRRYLLLGFRLLPPTDRNYAISYLPASDWVLTLIGQLIKSNVELLETD